MGYENLRDKRSDAQFTKVLDLSGRQTKNAGDATDSQDYVTLSQAQQMISDAIAAYKASAIINLSVTKATFVNGLATFNLQYKDWAGANQSIGVVISATNAQAVTEVSVKK